MMMFIISSKWQLYIMTPTWTNQLCGAQPVSEGVSLCHQQENLKIDIFLIENIDDVLHLKILSPSFADLPHAPSPRHAAGC